MEGRNDTCSKAAQPPFCHDRLAAAVAAIPAVGLCIGAKEAISPEDRIKAALVELEAAFAPYYERARIKVTFNGIKPSHLANGSVAVGMVMADR
jgi:hypothetical protein